MLDQYEKAFLLAKIASHKGPLKDMSRVGYYSLADIMAAYESAVAASRINPETYQITNQGAKFLSEKIGSLIAENKNLKKQPFDGFL